MEVKEIISLANLRGRMTFERKARIGFRHALTVIYHLDRGTAGIHHHDINRVSTGIHSILNQFLDDAGRTLYHLTSSNLVGNAVG
jgi:hypothetical protein